MRLAVTGAGGFVGRAVVAAALADPRVSVLTVTDRDVSGLPPDPRLILVPGDICDARVQAAALAGAEAVIHLAAVLGGAAEADPAASRRVNLDATLNLMAHARGRRFVLASTIAVYGRPPVRVDDATPCAPTLTYAMHKHMAEVALETATRRGDLDGIALRLPGVVPRPGDGAGLKSAFLSDLFHAMRAGRGICLPVAREGRTWLASPGAVAAGLIHAACLPPGRAGAVRAFALPALSPRFGDLVAALRAAWPDAPPPLWKPDAAIMAGFGAFGDLHPASAIRLGFPADQSLSDLIAEANRLGGA
jgi:D-erythronate 2-dehydrogenase